MNKKEAKPYGITPWEVSGDLDYEKLIKDFGVAKISGELRGSIGVSNPLIKREIYFAHRDADKWLSDAKKKKRVSILTGRGPSEKMHLGHLVPFLIAKSLQEKFGCDVYIPISDDEKFFVKEGLSYEKSIEYSKDNILDLIALGFRPGKTFIFEDFVYTDIYRYAAQIAKKTTYSTARAIFGLKPENNVGWTFYPAMQAAHILFPQFHKGKHMTLVPIGIDQDPYMRLVRDVAENFGFEKPAAIHAKFIPSLYGEAKMSSSDSGLNVIFLDDDKKTVETKIKKYAFSGGKKSIEEHRRLGGDPDIDISFQYLKIFFEPDDEKLQKIYDDYKSGILLTSELKEILIKRINDFLGEHRRKKELAKKQIGKFLMKN
ncbi:MAG: tryptophan--tRNA ligase [Nanoarchaeota archaeon]|nr:tryptophan--tRNA ligase [Nanoarchaeota archaeon]